MFFNYFNEKINISLSLAVDPARHRVARLCARHGQHGMRHPEVTAEEQEPIRERRHVHDGVFLVGLRRIDRALLSVLLSALRSEHTQAATIRLPPPVAGTRIVDACEPALVAVRPVA